ncbi:betaine-aldehyde dehydrogenase [Mycobacterium adipatum]|jgi:acyl-CoA reductase-like NAD-dependent aldehyde dehydrogenase|uniref:Putative succinate-semialdehyde dehydrogenase [NADP(+)] 2 n=1 Tax=Mycobacterium adipatum TaxID=1682113 RepID=A0A172UG49_9MYCO|nr:aldehyde dehydrogenase family protein [Mycobacterium adipatum]ANE78048.1 betaine-aldehyde dehydrogenase [Mycobacterium adipatum]MBI5737157.1 aldehyde dehydrogenase [Mycolicibacterium neoaurum]
MTGAPVGLLIGGDRITSTGHTHEHIFPATGLPNATVAMAGAADVDRAVDAARAAQREWMAQTVDMRRDRLIDLADAVHQHLDELATLNVQDYAVPISFAGTAHMLEGFLRHFAGYADKIAGSSTPVSGSFDVNLVEREPYGVVGVIAPWNGALAVAGSCVAPALAAGNAVIFKPSELAPLAALRFGELCLEAGLPPGLVNILPAGAEGGDALVRHPGIRKVHFTGGGTTARAVIRAAAENLTPVVAELGGKSGNIIFDDADLDRAAMLSAHQGPLMQSGQSCACASRLLVHASVYDTFVEKFLAVLDSAPAGDPFDPLVRFGPVISESALTRILDTVDLAVSAGAGELLTGGKRMGGPLAQGFYIEPTVFADVDNSSPLAQTETFGPVVSISRFTDDDQAVRTANDTRYGLNAFVHTRDLRRAHRVSRALESGSVWINSTSRISPQGPYGGYKQSGFGRTGGWEGLLEFLQTKTIRIGLD